MIAETIPRPSQSGVKEEKGEINEKDENALETGQCSDSLPGVDTRKNRQRKSAPPKECSSSQQEAQTVSEPKAMVLGRLQCAVNELRPLKDSQC